MALITRLSRLFHADMNAVLDQLEEPELLLKQAIREMEASLSHTEKHIKVLELNQKKLSNKHTETTQAITVLEQQITLCFESNKDELARVLIKRKLETTQHLKSVSTESSNVAEHFNQLKTQRKEHQSQLSAMKQKAEILIQEAPIHSDNLTGAFHSFSIQDEDVDVAFLHEKQKWSQS
ncbi:MAG: hypothetical protein GQ547_06740 [Methylophaga sp.]|nr:hypothetical protein [Methylophaga sp.]